MACGTSCCKFLLFSFNLIIALCSLALFLLAVLDLVSTTPYYTVANTESPDAAMPIMLVLLWIIVGVSAFAFLLSFIGCLGAVRESRCLMFCFGTVLAVVLMVELATIGIGYAKRDLVVEQVKQGFNASLPLYLTHPDSTRFWDTIQTDFKCCGLNGPGDWQDVFKNDTLPASCCPTLPFGETCTLRDDAASLNSCLNASLNSLHEKSIVIYAVAIIIGIIEIFGVILACCLGCSIYDQYRTV